MKNLKKMLAGFLVLVMILSVGMIAGATETNKNEVISRGEWLETLTIVFDMVVESEDLPDNYFSDLEESSPYYEAVMLAIEFGVVDISAGGEVQADEACTRDFAASTLNYCLGFQLEEETEYSFSDVELCSNPDSVQVAVNREWFVLTDGAFGPETPITKAEYDKMVADASEVIASAYVDEDFENQYVFADFVIEVSKDTDVVIDENDVVTLIDASQEIQEGDTFVVYAGELPVLYLAESVTEDGNLLIIETSEANEEEAVLSIEASGSVDVDLTQFEEAEGVETTYIRTAADARSAMQTYGISVKKDSVIATKEIEVGEGIDVSVAVNLSDLKLKQNIQTLKGNYYVAISGTSAISGNVSVDAIKTMGGKSNVVIGTVRVMGIGEVTISVDLALNGEVVVTYTGSFESGVQYQRGDGFRLVTTFKKKSFSTEAKANAKIGVKVLFGVDLIAAKANIYATTGLAAEFLSHTYGDGLAPDNCTNIVGWMYANVGAEAKLGIGKLSKTYKQTKDIYTKTNSPVFVSFHWEDSERVFECKREGMKDVVAESEVVKYYTPVNSVYGTSNYGGGKSTLKVKDAEPITIFTYELDKNNNATLTGYFGNVSVLSIPETIDGYKVLKIGENCFKENLTLKTVVIPKTVTRIRENAFASCLNLENVYLPKNLEAIENNAFLECDALREILIPKTVKTGGTLGTGNRNGAFRNCSNLKTVRFEYGTTEIATYLFAHCDGLENIIFPETVTTINEKAFYDCPSITELNLPNSMKKIGDGAFANCTGIEKLMVPDSVTHILEDAFSGCIGLTEVKLSKNQATVSNNAFYNCDQLTEMFIPKTMKSGGSLGTGDRNGAFRDCSNLKTFVFEEGIKEIPEYLFANCDGLEDIEIPDTVTIIGDHAFFNCKNLYYINLPGNLEKIYSYAFSGTVQLESIKLPQTLKLIESYAFFNCDSLTEINIPDSVTTLGKNVFDNCDALEKVVLGTGLTKIPSYCFKKCISLESIDLPYYVKEIENNAFLDCSELTEIYIPKATAKIGANTFSYPALLTIHGIEGTYAETYANNNDIRFVAVNNPVEGITIDREVIELKKGAKDRILLTLEPVNVTEEVIWTSSNPAVVKVEGNGTITAVKSGTSVITVTCGILDLSCTVTVKEDMPVTKVFSDVYNDWYTDYVQYVYDNSLMTGIKGTTRFEPNANITKAQVAQVLYNMEGQPTVEDKAVFTVLTDVYAGEWYANAVAWAFNTGVVTGDTNAKKFFPNADVTREQLALMIFRYAGFKGFDVSASSNLSGLKNAENVNNWAIDGVKWAVGQGLISGIEKNGVKDLAPQGNASRAQVSAILMRFCEAYGITK